jgi:PAS domain S-box-containing protein
MHHDDQQFHPDQLNVLELQHPGAMVVMLNMQGQYVYASSACLAVLGYEPDEVIGHVATEFAATEDIPHVEVTLKDALLNDVSVTVTIRVRTKSGELRLARGGIQKVIDPATDDVYLVGWVKLA